MTNASILVVFGHAFPHFQNSKDRREMVVWNVVSSFSISKNRRGEGPG
jgi:hypothetical protein